MVLPERFPFDLPRVIVRPDPKRKAPVAHVGADGKVCIAPDSNVLLDIERPGAIVELALELATKVLALPESQQVGEIQDEFSAYWRTAAQPDRDVISLLPATPSPGEVLMADILKRDEIPLRVLTESHYALDSYADRFNWQVQGTERSLLVRLGMAPTPPAQWSRFSGHDFLRMVLSSCTSISRADFMTWIRSGSPPLTVVCDAPLSGGNRVLFAGRVAASTSATTTKGFRPGKVTPAILVNRSLEAPLAKVVVKRTDPDYLITRSGGASTLQNATVVVVGCGSIGSHCASLLASLGVGKLLLVDSETLDVDNIHRHALGFNVVAQSKAKGLAKQLLSRFPRLVATPHSTTIENLLRQTPEKVLSADVLVLCIGHDTIERQLAAFLHSKARLIHAWVEPLGVGGHALTSFPGHAGCFECLYATTEGGLSNQATLLAPVTC